MSIYKERDSFLRNSIKSVLGQTFSDFELIIVDDGMTESNIKALKEFSDPRVKILKNSINLGLTKSLNKGIKQARGLYIARLDSDDWIAKERLAVQFKFLDENHGYVLCGTNHHEKASDKLVEAKTPFVTGDENLRRSLSSFNPFAHSSLLFRKSTFNEIHGYDESFDCAQDFDLIVKLSQKGKIENIDKVLTFRNVGHENISSRKNKKQVYNSLFPRFRSLFLYGGNLKTVGYFVKSFTVLLLPTSLTKMIRKALA